MKKKLLGILLVLCLFVCAFAICTSAATTISTAEELLTLMNSTDAAALAEDYTLGADIDLSTYSGSGDLTQASIGDGTLPFTGTFNGDGHTISGMSISEATQVGLFSTIEGATITNLNIAGSVTSTGNFVGGLVGVAIAPFEIDGVTADVTVTGGAAYNGGILGIAFYDTSDSAFSIKNSKNFGSVTSASGYTGGIVGAIGSNFSGPPAPATASTACTGNTALIEGCMNLGAITASSGNCGGGILGYYTHRCTSGMSYLTVNKCANYADVKVAAATGSYAGGIIGAVFDGNGTRYATVEFTKLLNTATVKAGAANADGAIVGCLRPTKVVDGKSNAYMADCVNTATTTSGLFAPGTKACAWNADRLYNAGGTRIITGIDGYDGAIVRNSNTITLSGCAIKTSGTSELATLAATDAYVSVCGTPALKEFAEISSVDDLLFLAAHEELWFDDYVLTTDLDLTDVDFTPIGNSSIKFEGKFDGAGHTISNLTISRTVGYNGLFGCTNGATIKNLNITGTVSGTSYNALLVGQARGGVIENVHVDGTVTGTGTNNALLAGRVVVDGTAYPAAVVKDCTSRGSASGTAYNGGMIADTLIGKNVAGSITLTGLRNYASVKGSGNAAGGIVGYVKSQGTTSDKTGNYTIDDCINYGDITGKQWSGGVIGAFIDTAGTYYYNASVTNVANFGTIASSSSKSCDGAIMGDIRLPVVDSSLTLTLENWYNRGTVTAGRGLLGTVSTVTDTTSAFTASNWYNATQEYYVALLSKTTAINGATVTYDNCHGNTTDVAFTHSASPITALTSLDGWEELGGETVLSNTITEISTADELIALASDPNLWGGNYRVTADIDLTGKEYTPIGSSDVKFSGIFDGDNKKITNLSITSSKQYAALFGMIWDGIVADVDLAGSITANQSRCAGLVGAVRANAVIRNCTVDVDVASTAYGALGGIIGLYTHYEKGYLLVENCVNNGDITGTQYIGGIIGYYLRGNLTSAADVVIKNSVNNGAITSIEAEKEADAAGIVGYVSASPNSTFDVEDCINNGEITATTKFIGGIVGNIYNASSTTVDNTHYTIKNCENHGDITAASTSAGILGYYNNVAAVTEGETLNSIIVDSCANYGNVIVNTYGAGVIGATSNSNYAINANITFTNLYNSGYVSGGTFGGEIISCIRPLKSGAYTFSDWHCRGSAPISAAGAFGSSKETSPTTFTFTRVFNENGENIVGTINPYNTVETVDCLTSSATAADIAALAAKDGWTAIANTAVPSFTVKTIGTADELEALMADEKAWDYNYKLTASIDLDGKTQSRIGEVTSKIYNPFTGIFDGQGYTVSGVDLSATSHGSGFFGYARNARFANVEVRGNSTSTVGLAGGFLGVGVAPIYIDNVINAVDVSSNGNYVGGLSAMLYFEEDDTDITITNVVNNGTVGDGAYTGGIVASVGSGFGDIGILETVDCKNNNFTLVNAVNNASVTSSTKNVAGGVLGYFMYRGTTGDNNVVINKCANYGDVSVTAANMDFAGGVIGALFESRSNIAATITVSELHNSGVVTSAATANSGTVIGLVRAPIAVDGVYPVTISDIYNDSESSLGLIGSTGSPHSDFAFTLSRAYNYGGANILAQNSATTGEVKAGVATVTLENCHNNASTDAANLLESNLWKDTSAQGPMLVEYAIADTLDNSIDSAVELLMLMNSPTRWSESFTVSKNIDLSTYKGDLEQKSIGNALYAFTGSFDGQGYTISGVNIAGTAFGTGFFGVVSSDGDATVIKDFTLQGSVTSELQFAGAVIGLVCGSAEISGITNEATVTSTYYGSNAGRLGGIVGVITLNNFLTEIRRVQSIDGTVNITIKDCVNKADITGTPDDEYAAYGQTRVAGIVGSVSPTHSNKGISNILIENCSNEGDITAHAITGGIIGKLEGGGHPENVITVTKCSNYGKITSTYSGGYNGWNGAYAGGIVGYAGLRFDDVAEGETVPEPCKSMTISYCYNAGEVTAPNAHLIGTTPYETLPDDFVSDDTAADEGTGEDGTIEEDTSANEVPSYFKRNAQIGGILGYACIGTDSVVITVNNCLNDGYIHASGHDIGGIVGIANPAHILDNHNRGKVESTLTYFDGTTERYGKYAGGIIGRINDSEYCFFSRNYNSGEVVSTGGAGFFGVGGGYNRYADAYLNNYYSAALTTDRNSTFVGENLHLASSFDGLNAEEAWVFTTKYGPELVYFHECDPSDYTWITNEDGSNYYACCDKTVVIENAETAYVYVDNNGRGSDANDGITKATALKTVEEAVTRLAKSGGKVILTSRYKVGEGINLPAYAKKITFTTESFETGFVVTNHCATFNLGGPTAFEKIIFNGSRGTARVDGGKDYYYNTLVIAANWNDLTVGPNISTYGNAYVVLGSNGVDVAEKDLGGKTVNLTLYRTHSQSILDSDENLLAGAVAFYDRLILGDRVSSNYNAPYTVKNVHINFTSNDATFNDVWLATTSNATCNAQMENYTVTANFNGISDAYINNLRTGDSNSASGTAYLDKLELNLNGTAYVKSACVIRNVKELVMTVSDGADRSYEYTASDGSTKIATKLNNCPFYISASEAYTTPGTVDITYGTHSFVKTVQYPAYNKIYTVKETVNDECTREDTIVEHTADALGTVTSTCTVCERSEVTEFHVLDYSTTAWSYDETEAAYVVACPVCGEILKSQEELPTVYVGDDGDDKADGYTAATKVKTITEAVERIAAVGGTVMFNGYVTLTEDTTLADWGDNTILFTADPETHVDGVAESGIMIGAEPSKVITASSSSAAGVQLTLGGKSEFDAIAFKGKSPSVDCVIINAMWHDIDFGYIHSVNYGACYLIAGKWNATESDTTPVTQVINIDGAAIDIDARTYFFGRVYLGSEIQANNIEISNKHITLNVENGFANANATERTESNQVYTLYTMSTTGNDNHCNSTTNGCVSVLNFNGEMSVGSLRTGDRNTSIAKCTGKCDDLTLNFMGNSNVDGSAYIRNCYKTTINVSTEAQGRTTPLAHSFFFYGLGSFVDSDAKVYLNYGSHSFVSAIAYPPVSLDKDNDKAAYVLVTDGFVDECNYVGTVTTPSTDTTFGVMTYTCDCGRSYTEKLCGTYAHEYVKQADGTYKCQLCGVTSTDPAMPEGSALITAFAGEIADGKVSVDILIDSTAVAGALFTVEAPEGFTLESVTNAEDSFHLERVGSKIMLVNLDGANVAVDNAVVATLNYTVDEKVFNTQGEIVVTALEVIDANERDIYTLTVNGVVAHKHTINRVLVADTADKAAYYICTCEACGYTYEEAAEAVEYSAAYSSTVVLESDLRLQIVAKVADKITDPSKIWLIVESTDKDGNVITEVVNPYHAYPADEAHTAFVYRFNATRVAAKEIGDEISVTFCVNKDGVKHAANTVKCNIISYYKAAKNAGASEVVMNALDAMMNYGAAAQEYFNYKTDALATTLAGVEKIDYSNDTSVKVDASTVQREEGLTEYTYRGLSAFLVDKVVTVVTFNGVADETLVFKGSYEDIKGNVKTFEKAVTIVDGVVTVEVDAIAAKDLRQVFTGALYRGDTQVSNSVTTGFEAYATQAISKLASESLLHAVCRAALAYSDAAKAYFLSK